MHKNQKMYPKGTMRQAQFYLYTVVNLEEKSSYFQKRYGCLNVEKTQSNHHKNKQCNEQNCCIKNFLIHKVKNKQK